jgi:hypothetical protein
LTRSFPGAPTAKKRSFQSPNAKHIGGVVAELPGGSSSEYASFRSRT